MMASMAELTDRDVLSMRLANLRLSLPGRSPADLVDWFGAMQAQDLASGKWSLGVRIPGSREADIDAALASGEVIRTWPMRGTIHLIHPQNARWMLELTGSRALMGLQKRWDYLGLDRQTVDRAADVLRDALRGGNRLTRGQCLDVLSDAGIDTGPGRSYHLLWHTAQIGVTCIGPNEGKEQTFVLLEDSQECVTRRGIGELAESDCREELNSGRPIFEAAAQGRSVVIMLHKITSGPAADALEMRQSNLTLICAAVADLELAGTMQNATLGELVAEMRANVGAA